MSHHCVSRSLVIAPSQSSRPPNFPRPRSSLPLTPHAPVSLPLLGRERVVVVNLDVAVRLARADGRAAALPPPEHLDVHHAQNLLLGALLDVLALVENEVARRELFDSVGSFGKRAVLVRLVAPAEHEAELVPQVVARAAHQRAAVQEQLLVAVLRPALEVAPRVRHAAVREARAEEAAPQRGRVRRVARASPARRLRRILRPLRREEALRGGWGRPQRRQNNLFTADWRDSNNDTFSPRLDYVSRAPPRPPSAPGPPAVRHGHPSTLRARVERIPSARLGSARRRAPHSGRTRRSQPARTLSRNARNASCSPPPGRPCWFCSSISAPGAPDAIFSRRSGWRGGVWRARAS